MRQVDGADVLGGLASVGDPFSGTFSYDTNGTSVQSTTSEFDIYPFSPQLFGLDITLGPAGSFRSPSNIFPSYTVGIRNDGTTGPLAPDVLSVSTMRQPPIGWPGDSTRVIFFMSLEDATGQVFSDRTLPSELQLESFDVGSITIQAVKLLGGGSTEVPWTIRAEVTGLWSVPEPATAVLISLGVVVLCIPRARARTGAAVLRHA